MGLFLCQTANQTVQTIDERRVARTYLRVFRGGRDDSGGREAVREPDGDGVRREGHEAHAHEGPRLARLGLVAQEAAQDLLEGVPGEKARFT